MRGIIVKGEVFLGACDRNRPAEYVGVEGEAGHARGEVSWQSIYNRPDCGVPQPVTDDFNEGLV